jgi:hypothetical protein
LWRPSALVRLGTEIVLVRATCAPGGFPTNPGDPPPLLKLDPSVRRMAETQARPHLAAGTSPPDQAWQPWIPSGERVMGLEAVVDVSDQGFAAAPTLLASLAAAPGQAGTDLLARIARLRRQILTHVVIDDPKAWAGQFRFRVIPADKNLLDPSTVPDGPLKDKQSYRSPLRIAWLALEPAAGRPPVEGEVLGRKVRCCRPAPAGRAESAGRSL